MEVLYVVCSHRQRVKHKYHGSPLPVPSIAGGCCSRESSGRTSPSLPFSLPKPEPSPLSGLAATLVPVPPPSSYLMSPASKVSFSWGAGTTTGPMNLNPFAKLCKKRVKINGVTKKGERVRDVCRLPQAAYEGTVHGSRPFARRVLAGEEKPGGAIRRTDRSSQLVIVGR